MLAIQNQIQLMRAKADDLFNEHNKSQPEKNGSSRECWGRRDGEFACLRVDAVRRDADNDLNLVDNIAPVRGVSNKTGRFSPLST